MNYPITFHKTAVLVTFSGKCDKILSQKVILWQTLWQNRLKTKKSNHNREITNIVVFNFEESRIQLVWDFCLKLQVRYNLLNIRLLFADAKYVILSIETFWKVIGLWISISYEGYLAHVCQNQAVTCAKPCANTDKYNYLWALLAHFEYPFGRLSCANLMADCWHMIVNIKPNRRRSCSSDIFGVFCWVKRGIKRHQDIDNYLFVWFGIYIVHRPN